MSKDAGRKKMLVVIVRAENGENWPMILDTGAEGTCFDKSMEPKLGKRLVETTFWNFGKGQDAGIYAAPKLFLGNTLLEMTGTNIATIGLRKMSGGAGGNVVGIIGMDVLAHYCIQLDFAANRIRFLDPERADKKSWGRAIPLIDSGDGCFYIEDNLAGVKGSGSLIDTGCDYDGWLKPDVFEQWTNHSVPPGKGEVRSPNGTLGGETYHELNLSRLDDGLETNDSHMRFNGIGLHVLSENLVTLDFPEKTMYLKRTSEWPLYDKSLASDAKWQIKPVIKMLEKLKKKGQLPGWSKKDHSEEGSRAHFEYHHDYMDFVTVDAKKKEDPSLYHYSLRRAKGGPWKLERAWRTDQNGATIDEYSLSENHTSDESAK